MLIIQCPFGFLSYYRKTDAKHKQLGGLLSAGKFVTDRHGGVGVESESPVTPAAISARLDA